MRVNNTRSTLRARAIAAMSESSAWKFPCGDTISLPASSAAAVLAAASWLVAIEVWICSRRVT
jgi:hypothetical protein